MSGVNPLKTLLTVAVCGLICGFSWPTLAEESKKTGKTVKIEEAADDKNTVENAASSAKKDAIKGADPTLIVLDPVPQQFELWVDKLGFNWQLMQTGALQSGPATYFQSAMTLSIKGKSFKATKGMRLDGGEVNDEKGARIVLRGESDGIKVVRDIWYDQRRGGVRYIDSFFNEKGKEPVRLAVQLKTMFRSTWQDLHGSSGKIIGGRGSVSLNSRDHGVLVKYSRTDGRPDTVFLVAGDGEVKKPRISFSSNHRELTFSYDLEVPAGKKVALVHWIMQRKLSDPGEVVEALRPFYLRRRLLQPQVAGDIAKVTANFTADALPEHSVEPYSLESLVALKQATHASGAQRLWEDVLWITGENQLAGEVNGAARLKIKTVLGERETVIKDVAAIQGGGGVGRTPRVFLRDGQVLAGDIVAEKLTMTSRDGWDMELKVEDLMFLLTHLEEVDGKAPEGAGAFVALRSGDVLAIDQASDAGLEILSPWGADRVPLAEIVSLRYTNGSVPKYRIHRKDGSWMSVFLNGPDLTLKSVSGDVVKVRPGEISGIWRAKKKSLGADEKADGDDWLDFEDIAERKSLPTPCCLLMGSNLMHGDIAMEVLHLVSGGAVTKINPREIVSMERLDESDAMPVFDVELSGGNRLRGQLRERSLIVKTQARSWNIPVQHFLGYLSKEAE